MLTAILTDSSSGELVGLGPSLGQALAAWVSDFPSHRRSYPTSRPSTKTTRDSSGHAPTASHPGHHITWSRHPTSTTTSTTSTNRSPESAADPYNILHTYDRMLNAGSDPGMLAPSQINKHQSKIKFHWKILSFVASLKHHTNPLIHHPSSLLYHSGYKFLEWAWPPNTPNTPNSKFLQILVNFAATAYASSIAFVSMPHPKTLAHSPLFEHLYIYSSFQDPHILDSQNLSSGSKNICSTFFTDFSDLLASIAIYTCHIIIVGNLNIHLDRPDDKNTKKLQRLLARNNLTQLVSEPTQQQHGQTMDVVMSSRASTL